MLDKRLRIRNALKVRRTRKARASRSPGSDRTGYGGIFSSGFGRKLAAVSAMSLTALVAGCGSEAQQEATPVLRIMGPADGSDQYAKAAQVCSDASGGKYRLEYDISAKQTDDQRLQLARRIVGGDSSFDIMGLDVTWTPEFAEAGWALPLPEDVAKRVTDGTLSGPLDTATWKDKLYGAPLNTNTQLLWYRKSLVDGTPKTWDDLITAGERLADQGKPSMIGVQAAQYEGSVVWLNSMTESAGGQLVAPDGQSVTISDNNAAERALDTMHRVATAKGHDPSISQSDENQARLAFDRGDAFAQVNYPFVFAGVKEKAESGDPVAKEVFDDLAWTTYPAMDKDKPAKVTIGGLNLAVPSTSKHPDLAFDAIECLRNEKNQLNNALTGGLPPTLTRLYTQATEEFKEEYPFYREIYEQLNKLEDSESADLTQEEKSLLPSSRRAGVVTRPKSPAYQSLSILMASRISPPEDINAKPLVSKLDEELQAAVNSEGLVP